MIQPTDDDADFKMMTSLDDWPTWPVLGIKKKEGNIWKCATLFEHGNKVYLSNTNLMEKLDPSSLSNDPVTPDKARELVEEGWVVD